MMTGLVSRREDTPADDVIGLDLGPIYDASHPGTVHIVTPARNDAGAIVPHSIILRQQTVSNQAREKKRKQADEVFQRVYRNGPLAPASMDKPTPATATAQLSGRRTRRTTAGAGAKVHMQRSESVEIEDDDSFRMQVMRLRYSVHKQKDEAKPEATRSNYRNRQKIFMVIPFLLSCRLCLLIVRTGAIEKIILKIDM